MVAATAGTTKTVGGTVSEPAPGVAVASGAATAVGASDGPTSTAADASAAGASIAPASGAAGSSVAGASVAGASGPVVKNGTAAEQPATGNTTDLTRTPLQTAMQHFLKCCKTRETPRTDGVEGLNVLRVLVAAQESLKKKKAVVLDGADKNKVESSNMYFKHPTAIVDSGGEHWREYEGLAFFRM